MSVGYKRIHYDNRNNNAYIWYFDEQGEHKVKFKPDVDYWVLDKSNKSPIKDIFGNPVVRKIAENSYEMKDSLRVLNCSSSESNVAMETKILHSFFKDKDIAVDMSKINICTIDIEIESERDFPKAEEAKYPINLITLHFSKTNETFTFGNREYTGDMVSNYIFIPDEKTMLTEFVKLFRKKKVDCISGWFIQMFDVPYIINRLNNLDIEISLSPVNEYAKKMIASKAIQKETFDICGISILDYMDLYVKFEREKRASYSLNYIAGFELGEGKHEIDGPMHLFYRTNWNEFVEYNVQDTMLVVKLEQKKRYIELAVTLSYGALTPFDKVYSTTAVLTGVTKKFLNNRNMVFPDAGRKLPKQAFPGGYVMANAIFLKYVMSFDFESLYPHIMMQFGISPESLVQLRPGETPDPSWIRTPASDTYSGETKDGEVYSISGIYYKNDKGVIPEITYSIFSERKELKNKAKIADGFESGLSAEAVAKSHGFDLAYVIEKKKEIDELGRDSGYYKNQEYVRKILVNSLFGSIASSAFGGMYDVRNAAMITIIGQTVIKYVGNMVNEYSNAFWVSKAKKIFNVDVKPIIFDVICLTDTDSSYIHLHPYMRSLGIEDLSDAEFVEFADKMANEYFKPMFKKALDMFAAKYNCKNKLNFKQEKSITHFLVQSKKHYAMRVVASEGKVYKEAKIATTGLEDVKSSTPIYCKEKLSDFAGICLVNSDNKAKVLEYIRPVRETFMKMKDNITNIASPKSAKDFDKWYKGSLNKCASESTLPKFVSGCPVQVRASLFYNFMIEKYDLPLEPIGDGNKIKFIYVHPQNPLKTDVIGFRDEWPKEFDEYFKVDFDTQFQKSFVEPVQRFFDVMKWGTVIFADNEMDDFFG